MRTIAFVLLAIIAFTIAGPAPFKLCPGDVPPSFQVKTIDVTPSGEIQPGTSVTATIDGISGSEVSSGKLVSTISLEGIDILENEYDLCQIASGGCPIKAGPASLKVVLDVPGIAGPGQYNTKHVVTGDSKQIACALLNFTVAG
ncbi:phosphatidylglycerol/phosphatidylinositol transfer protein [Acrasis kona]|uniref:Phosphatidylglycerol/phosphatidylinositol transfer protein n=1 Tax=Acrasis kona TaxID=1008807 RepID=A0AAW2Z2J1_9EUKA